NMLARGHGTIVNVASLAGIAPVPAMLYYNAAKAGLAAASEALHGELMRSGVHVVTVYPGPGATAMERAAREVYGDRGAVNLIPTGRPEVLARRIRRAVERRRARVIYPRFYALARHFPALTRWIIDRVTPPLSAI